MSSPGRQYAGKSSGDRRAERRARLLAGGLELIGDDGVGALSVRGVCGRASVTPRYFYEEFGTLDDFARVLQQSLEHMQRLSLQAQRDGAAHQFSGIEVQRPFVETDLIRSLHAAPPSRRCRTPFQCI